MAKSLFPLACVAAWLGCSNARPEAPPPSKSSSPAATTPARAPGPQVPQHPPAVQIPLWPETASDAPAERDESKGLIAGKPYRLVHNVSRPTMTIYPPLGKSTGAAVVVFPGGGYKTLAIDLEGTEACDWLTSKGITCVLLKYRVPHSGPYWDDRCRCHINPKPAALEDAQRAIGLVRSRAAEWQIDPRKIGVLGFSAGGHLSAAISTSFARRLYPAVDAADKESCRPDFAVIIYPGHLWAAEDKAGDELELNPDVRIVENTPPTFLLHAQDDRVDDINHSLVYYLALRKAGIPVEMHLYAQGGHAFGLRRTHLPITAWPDLVETWLKSIGMIPD